VQYEEYVVFTLRRFVAIIRIALSEKNSSLDIDIKYSRTHFLKK